MELVMKSFVTTILLLIVFEFFAAPASAAWLLAPKDTTWTATSRTAWKQSGFSKALTFHKAITPFTASSSNLDHHNTIYALSMSGSLKENVERIMHRYHWKVIWKSLYDYNFDGKVTGNSLPSMLDKLFKPFPLQAQLFLSNRTMIVISRNLNEF